MNPACVHRKILKTPSEFREFLQLIGQPEFGITNLDGESEFLQEDEWIFSNDADLLMQALLDWEKRNCKLVYQDADEEFDGAWNVIGLPDYFNDAAAMVRIEPANGSSESDDARRAFFDEIRENADTYGFFSLKEGKYGGYLEDWDTEYDQQVNPEKYRAQKSTGVIVDFYGTKIGRQPMKYFFVFENGESGFIMETQLREVGMRANKLVGAHCVVNGLCEVEQIGVVNIPSYVEPGKKFSG